VKAGEAQFRLEPGYPMQFSDGEGAKLLARARGKVRVVQSDVVLEPAAANAKPIFWENAIGIVIGPATPEWLARVGDGGQAAFWIVASFQGLDRWIRSDRLRSKHAFDTQRPMQVIELVREAR
jgi:hypothetical protein